MSIIKRCPRCTSIWVCWNWLHIKDSDLLRPTGDGSETWTGECWNCAACIDTPYKVRNGIPYWILRRFGSWFTNHELFERNFREETEAFHKLLEESNGDVAKLE